MKKLAKLFITALVAVSVFVSCSSTEILQSREIPEQYAEIVQYASDYTVELDGKLHFYFFASNGYQRTSIKTGDSCLIVFPDGQTMLIDSCESTNSDLLTVNLLKMGITHLDYCVLSHAHSDHAAGFYKDGNPIFENFTVGKFYFNGANANVNRKVMANLTVYKIPYEPLTEGDTLEIGGVKITILNPPVETIGKGITEEEEHNNSSIVMRFDYGDFSALFTGDLYLSREQELVAKYKDSGLLDVDFLKICHHGRSTSSCSAFVYAVTPELAVATGNCVMETRNYYIFSQAGATVLMDFCDGYIQVVSDGEGFDYSHSLERTVTIYDNL